MAGWMLVLAPLTVSAAEGDKVILNPADGNIQVKITVDNAAVEKITGVSVVLHVDVTRGKEAVTFTFADGLADAVTGSRYKEGNLYLYVASDREIFQADDQLELGKLSVLAADAAQGLTARVSYSEGTLQTVNKAYGEKMVTPGEVSDSVMVEKDGAQTPAPTPPVTPTQPPAAAPGTAPTQAPETEPTQAPTETASPAVTPAPATTAVPATKPGITSGSGSGTMATASPVPEQTPAAPAETAKNDLFDDGSVLVEQSPATQEVQKPDPDTPDTISVPEESRMHETISQRDIIIIMIIGIVVLIAFVIAQLWWKKIKGRHK